MAKFDFRRMTAQKNSCEVTPKSSLLIEIMHNTFDVCIYFRRLSKSVYTMAVGKMHFKCLLKENLLEFYFFIHRVQLYSSELHQNLATDGFRCQLSRKLRDGPSQTTFP